MPLLLNIHNLIGSKVNHPEPIFYALAYFPGLTYALLQTIYLIMEGLHLSPYSPYGLWLLLLS